MHTILLAGDEVNLRIPVHATIEDSTSAILEAGSGTEALVSIDFRPSSKSLH